MSADQDSRVLLDLAEQARTRSAWLKLADFCEQRGKGLRDEALKHLNGFLGDVSGWRSEDRLAVVIWLLEASRRLSNQGHLLAQPLVAGLVIPALRDWRETAPEDPTPRLWLGKLHCDVPSEHLQEALSIDPGCDEARWLLSQWRIGDVEYSQHHLPDYYIGEPSKDLAALEEVVALAAGFVDRAMADAVCQEVEALRSATESWMVSAAASSPSASG